MLRNNFILLLFITIFAGCNIKDDSNDILQTIAIEDYLTSQEVEFTIVDGVYRTYRTSPLVEEETTEEGTTEEGTTEGDTAEGATKEGTTEEVEQLVIVEGDSVYINYVGYIFTSSPNGVFVTNVESIGEVLGFSPEDKVYAPLGIKYGTTPLVEGLNRGLKGLKNGDMVSIFMNYTLAFGDAEIGLIPSESAISYDIDIIEVKRAK